VGDGFIHGKTCGFYFDTASDILLEDCSVAWGDIRPDHASEAIQANHIDNLKVQPQL